MAGRASGSTMGPGVRRDDGGGVDDEGGGPHPLCYLCSPIQRRSPSVRTLPSPHFRSGTRRPARGLSGGPESRAAQGGGDYRGAAAGAGGGGDGQDAGLDHAAGAYPGHQQGPAVGAAGRHLHQQGRARDARADHPHHRRPGRGAAVAGHVPLGGGPDPAPARRVAGAEIELHHPGYRRCRAAAQTVDRGGGHRPQALDGLVPGKPHRPLEKPRLDARGPAGQRGWPFRRR